MKLHTILNLSLAVGLLAPGLLSATSCSAAEPLSPIAAPAVKTETSAPAVDLDPASQRVEQAKLKLDQARAQVSASRAMLKAAEAEFRAAKADREALTARNEAIKLADASGLKDDGVQPVQPQAAITFGTNRLYPAASAPTPSAPAPAATPAPDMASTRIQQADFNAPQKDDAGAVADLRPTKAAGEPTQAP
ncbi:MAG: hypothetical protein HYX67_07175 [Candidatus Melainabacteria bacterium]|nr:hypothetical protein [Candidatus Melainabacteria bacterium]